MRILVTGGTGSFGNALVDRLADNKDCEMIRVFSRDEEKQHVMRQRQNSGKMDFIVGDVRDKDSLRTAVRGVDYVFHAAALKQVPTGELFPQEMIATNIIGTRNLIEAMEETEGKMHAILLSTDKAVFPINTMGISKAMAEKLFLATPKNRRHTYNVVRYGNVMASRGSVLPLFIDKIKAGESLPITNPEMTRFLLSLDDAIDLVLHALSEQRSGELFIKKAPAAKIKVIADALSVIFNTKVDQKIIGTRAGEKDHETLVTSMELRRAIDNGDFIRVKSESDLDDYDSFFTSGSQKAHFDDYTSANTNQLDLDGTVALFNSLDYIKKRLND